MANLTFYYGAMKCGKTTKLITQYYNYKHENADEDVMCFAYKNNKITSKLGSLNISAIPFSEGTDIKKYIFNCKTIFIDEAQFLLKRQVLQLTDLADIYDININCYGLRTDFRGVPFEGSVYLMAWSTNLEEIVSYNNKYEKLNFQIRMNHDKRVTNGEQIEIGQHYKPVSRREFNLSQYIPK